MFALGPICRALNALIVVALSQDPNICKQHVAEKITSKYHHNLVMGNAVHRFCIANRFAIVDLLNPLNVKVAEIFHSCVAEKRLLGDWKINRSLVSVIFREI